VESVGSFCDFDEVESELGFDGSLDFSDFGGEDDGVEFFDHLAGGEFAEVSASSSGGAFGMFFGEVGEIGAGFDLGFEIETFLFGIDENVSCSSFGHEKLLIKNQNLKIKMQIVGVAYGDDYFHLRQFQHYLIFGDCSGIGCKRPEENHGVWGLCGNEKRQKEEAENVTHCIHPGRAGRRIVTAGRNQRFGEFDFFLIGLFWRFFIEIFSRFNRFRIFRRAGESRGIVRRRLRGGTEWSEWKM